MRHLAVSMCLVGLLLTVVMDRVRTPVTMPELESECALEKKDGEGRVRLLRCGADINGQEARAGRAEMLDPAADFTLGRAMDIECADERELRLLPGIGSSRAKAIIEYRRRNKGIGSVEELLNVKGIGTTTLARIRPRVRLSSKGCPSGNGADER